MLNCCVEATAIEPFLQPLTEVIGLAGLAARYTQLDFVARPTTPAQLALACDAAFAATEPLRLAQQLFQSARSHDALKVVDWGLATFKPSLQLHLLGASIAEKLEDFGRATEYLDGAIMLKPTDLGLRFRRCDLRWWVYRHRPGPTPPRLDAEGEALLQDLEICKQLRTDRHASEPYVRRAFVFRQSGNLNAAAEELYQATELEQSDIAVVYEYAKVLAELKQPELVRAALAEGIKRADLMVKAGMMEKSEAQTW
jgi:Tfp pilus assembly protein PilF